METSRTGCREAGEYRVTSQTSNGNGGASRCDTISDEWAHIVKFEQECSKERGRRLCSADVVSWLENRCSGNVASRRRILNIYTHTVDFRNRI